jgi:hypothetical protein
MKSIDHRSSACVAAGSGSRSGARQALLAPPSYLQARFPIHAMHPLVIGDDPVTRNQGV